MPRAYAQKSPLPVRLAQDIAGNLRAVNDLLKGPSFNRLFSDLVVEIVELAKNYPFSMAHDRLLSRLRKDADVRAYFQKMRKTGIVRRIPNEQTITAKLPLLFTQREAIFSVANQLHWTTAQVVLEALQTACDLVVAEELILELPAFFSKYRGSMVYEGKFGTESRGTVLEVINHRFGFLGKADLSPPSSEAQTPMVSYVDLL